MFALRMTLAVILLATVSVVIVPQSSAVPVSDPYPGQVSVPAVSTKVFLDSAGAVHILWTVHSGPAGTPAGIWYAKYAANGTNSIPPMMLRNSTAIQSADMAVDEAGNPHIVWAEGPAFANSTVNLLSTTSDSQLYYAEINTTNDQITSPTTITGLGKIAMWPSIALDEKSNSHIVWMEESIDTKNRTLSEYCGAIAGNHLDHPILIANYTDQTLATVPRPHVIYDESYADLHIAWVYSQQHGSDISSQVTYARVNLSSSQVKRIAVAELPESLQDTAVALGGNGSAYVVWQSTVNSLPMVYVSKISSGGSVIFLRSFREPSSSSAYLTTYSDSQENLFVIWYQPPSLPRTISPQTSSTSVSYVRIDEGGLLADSGNDSVAGTVLAIGVSRTDDLYAISSLGLIKVRNPAFNPAAQIVIGIAACVGAGVAATEEGRYRLVSSFTRISDKRHKPELHHAADRVALRLLNERPGFSIREIKASKGRGGDVISLRRLAQLERAGYVSSVRVGLGRRFFESIREPGADSSRMIATRILNEIKKRPGTWEGRLAQDLNLSQQIVHYHLKRLRAAGVLSVELEGRRILYRLANCPK
jgi:DNA-binding transcriptional ArsR family regulator